MLAAKEVSYSISNYLQTQTSITGSTASSICIVHPIRALKIHKFKIERLKGIFVMQENV